MLSSSSSSTGRERRSVKSSSSSLADSGSSSTSSSSLYETPAVFSLISPSPSSSSSSVSVSGAFDNMASRSRISRSCISPSLSAFDQSIMAWKVIGLSQSPRIIVSRPDSIRFAMAISPSRDSNSTAPISRKYMRTGSSVRSPVPVFLTVLVSERGSFSEILSTVSTSSSSCSSSPSSPASSFSTICTPMSLMADMTSSICSEDIWSCGRAAFNSS